METQRRRPNLSESIGRSGGGSRCSATNQSGIECRRLKDGSFTNYKTKYEDPISPGLYLKRMGMTDHTIANNRLIRIFQIRKMIEFGLGEGTKEFLDNEYIEKLTSVEIYTEEKDLAMQFKISDRLWADKCREDFKGYRGWDLKMIECKLPLLQAERDVVGFGNVARGSDPTSDDYKRELKEIVDSLDVEQYDYAFVDAGIHLRGDIVNELFSRVPIIGAHDTKTLEIYGYNRIYIPDEYIDLQVHSSFEGVTFWFKKSLLEERKVDIESLRSL